MTETHTILGGKVHVYRRPKSSNWQCSTYLAGKNRRRSTKEDSLSKAKEIAEDWYLQLRGQAPHRDLFNIILAEEGLKTDREGRPRTAYSLRHTYICLRLMEGADIYQIAKNCRTSVEMIEKYYAAHIKTNLDAAAIKVMRPRHPRPEHPEHQKPDHDSGHDPEA